MPELVTSQAHAVGWWALQFTPRVAIDAEAVVLEVAASQRLFGGEDALRERVRLGALDMGCRAVAWAPTAGAAIAVARGGGPCDGFAEPLTRLLDGLPLETLTAAAQQQHTLVRLGCRTLGDVRKLPRGGLSRRFGQTLLDALDAAYGRRPAAYEWLVLPDTFSAKLELPARVDLAEGLMFGARRLLMQLAGWLAARHAGVRSFTLRWRYDFHRASDVPPAGELTIRTADTTRHMDHFSRLLSEQLAKLTLPAPVEEIALEALESEPLEEFSGSLLPDALPPGETVTQLLERLEARLGPGNVLRATLRSDYRPEAVQTWQPATQAPPKGEAPLPDLPQPTWLVDPPRSLAVRGERPMYQGVLDTISGPHRIDGAWWDRRGADGCALARRDYYVMASPHAGLLWVYRDRAAEAGQQAPAWYLHGIFG